MATMYGTIPTLSPDLPADQWNDVEGGSWWDLGRRRPWEEMMSPLSLPESFNDSLTRINANATHFHMNYVIIVVSAVILSLLWHPVSLAFFAVVVFACVFLYFLHHESVVVMGYEVNGHVAVTTMSMLTVVLLVTRATKAVVVGILIGTAVVAVHGAVRKPNDDLILDEEPGGGGGGNRKVDLKEAGSAAFTSYA